MKTIEQVREEYLKLIGTVGVDEVITKVHREIGLLEPKTFDGGFNPESFARLQAMRTLARDLYSYQLNLDSKSYYQKK